MGIDSRAGRIDRLHISQADLKVASRPKSCQGSRTISELELACRSIRENHSPQDIVKLLKSRKRPPYISFVLLRAFYLKLEVLFKSNKEYVAAFRRPKFFTKKALLDPLTYYLFDEYLTRRKKLPKDFPKKRRVEPLLEKISNNYHLNEFIYEFDNGMVMHSEIFDAFKKYSDAVELKNILPEKTYAGVSAKNLTKKLLMNALIFKLLGDCMNGRRETDQRVKGVLNTINKYKPWSNFVFKIKEKAHIPKPVYEEFMKFYNAENE